MITKNLQNEEFGEPQMHAMLGLYKYLADLKSLYRQGWITYHGLPTEKCESVAEHIFSGAIFAYVFAREHFPELDAHKVLIMYLFHDLAEARAGDITPHEKVDLAEHHEREKDAIEKILGSFVHGPEYVAHWTEYEEQLTAEARFVRIVDRLDGVMMAKVYELSGLVTSRTTQEFTARLEEMGELPAEVKEIVEQLRGLSVEV